jgi:hypothetical protein
LLLIGARAIRQRTRRRTSPDSLAVYTNDL